MLHCHPLNGDIFLSVYAFRFTDPLTISSLKQSTFLYIITKSKSDTSTLRLLYFSLRCVSSWRFHRHLNFCRLPCKLFLLLTLLFWWYHHVAIQDKKPRPIFGSPPSPLFIPAGLVNSGMLPSENFAPCHFPSMDSLYLTWAHSSKLPSGFLFYYFASACFQSSSLPTCTPPRRQITICYFFNIPSPFYVFSSSSMTSLPTTPAITPSPSCLKFLPISGDFSLFPLRPSYFFFLSYDLAHFAS